MVYELLYEKVFKVDKKQINDTVDKVRRKQYNKRPTACQANTSSSDGDPSTFSIPSKVSSWSTSILHPQIELKTSMCMVYAQ